MFGIGPMTEVSVRANIALSGSLWRCGVAKSFLCRVWIVCSSTDALGLDLQVSFEGEMCLFKLVFDPLKTDFHKTDTIVVLSLPAMKI
jgi:hypothetical protein